MGQVKGQAVGFHFPFKNIFCRVHTPWLLHFLSSSDMPDPDSFCRSYFCYGTSIRSLKSRRAVRHTDPIPAVLPLPAVLRQSLPAVFTAKSSTVNTFERMENYIADYDSL